VSENGEQKKGAKLLGESVLDLEPILSPLKEIGVSGVR